MILSGPSSHRAVRKDTSVPENRISQILCSLPSPLQRETGGSAPYAFQGQMGVDEVMGNSPYGASTIAGGDGSRQPSQVELEGARYQGRHVAQIAGRLFG
mgnify:CR=1 FL=1